MIEKIMYIKSLFNITNRFIDKCLPYLEISIVNGLHALVIAIKMSIITN